MSNKNVRVKVRILGLVEELRDKGNLDHRPGRAGGQRFITSQIPTVEISREEWDQRLYDAEHVLQWGYVLSSDRPPIVITDEADGITDDAVELHGTVNPWDVVAVVTFEYGTTEALGTSVAADESPVTAAVNTPVSYSLAGLEASTKYYYRVKLVNATKTVYGLIRSFVTDAPPAI